MNTWENNQSDPGDENDYRESFEPSMEYPAILGLPISRYHLRNREYWDSDEPLALD